MKYETYQKLCIDEFERYVADVTELHLDDVAYNELIDSLDENRHYSTVGHITSIMNPVTGTQTKIVRHHNHAILRRPPQPPMTEYEVSV